MNRDDIIRMAREAGFDPHDMSDDFTCNLMDIERFANLVAAAEREACAKVCDEQEQRSREFSAYLENAMIYKTFKEWKDGNYLEDLEPRKEAYTRDELLLVEMGWKYGFDAGVEAGRKDENEACAKVCEAEGKRVDASWVSCAFAIRERGAP